MQEKAIPPAFLATIVITFITLWITTFCPVCGQMMISLRSHRLCQKCISLSVLGKKVSSLHMRIIGLTMLIIGLLMLAIKPDYYTAKYSGTVSGLIVGGLYFLVHG